MQRLEVSCAVRRIYMSLGAKRLNPIRHLLALVGAHHILHVSRVRVNENFFFTQVNFANVFQHQNFKMSHQQRSLYVKNCVKFCMRLECNPKYNAAKNTRARVVGRNVYSSVRFFRICERFQIQKTQMWAPVHAVKEPILNLGTSRPGSFTLVKNQGTCGIHGWMSSRTGLDGLVKRKISYHCWESNYRPSVQPIIQAFCRLCHTGYKDFGNS